MVSAHHLIWTAYGYWLPNDPRGSMSKRIRAASIEDLGDLHHGRKRILPAYRELARFHDEASESLKYPLIKFTNAEIELIGASFKEEIASRPYTCYACAIMPDHVHLVMRKHRDDAEEMISRLQGASRKTLLSQPNVRHESEHPVWGGPGWKVYLDSAAAIERVCEYVRLNPIKARRPEQCWEFVTPYDGWLAGVGTTRRAGPRY